MTTRIYSIAFSILLMAAPLSIKAQTLLPPWEKDGGFWGTDHNMIEIDEDNFGGVGNNENYSNWLLFGRVAGSAQPSWTGNGYDHSARKVGFIAAENKYIDWYPGWNKRMGGKQFQSMHFGFIESPDADEKAGRSRVNLMTLLPNGNFGIGTTNPGDRLDIQGGNLRVGGNGTDQAMVRLAGTGELRLLYKYNNTHKIGFSDGENKWLGYSEYSTGNWLVPTGKIGIGTVSPTNTLQLQNSLYADGVSIGFSANGGSTPTQARIRVADKNWSGHMLFETTVPGSSAGALTERMRIQNDGKVGIGTTTPSSKLHLVTEGSRASAGSAIDIDGSTIIPLQSLPFLKTSLRLTNTEGGTSSSYDAGFGVGLWGSSNNFKTPFLDIETYQDDMPIVMEINNKATMQIFQNQVLIGSNLPSPASGSVIPFSGMNYTLGVRGRIVASGLTCKDLSQWADYVFDDSYALKPLEEVSEYIAEHKHLPDVPSNKEVIEKGIDVSEMLKIQMQKIEELTLYTIEQQKQLKQQQKQINTLTQQLEKVVR